jgi:hypothetical protein
MALSRLPPGDHRPQIESAKSGTAKVATEANETARKILALRESHRTKLGSEGKAALNLLRALDVLFEHPVITVRPMQRWLFVGLGVFPPIVVAHAMLAVADYR